jgi:hypothetical protein
MPRSESIPPIKIKPALFYLLKILVLAVVILLAARLGLSMAYVQVNTFPVWPPAGIALAALLLFGPGMWPRITLGVFLGSLLTKPPFNLAAGLSLGNTLEAVAAFASWKQSAWRVNACPLRWRPFFQQSVTFLRLTNCVLQISSPLIRFSSKSNKTNDDRHICRLIRDFWKNSPQIWGLFFSFFF